MYEDSEPEEYFDSEDSEDRVRDIEVARLNKRNPRVRVPEDDLFGIFPHD